MTYILSIFAGILQGLTEFLPISSSGHLVLFHDLLKIDLPDDLTFDVILHLGTLVALILFFWSDIIKYLKAFLKSFISSDFKNDIEQKLAWYILIATIPAAVFGYLFEEQIKSIFRNPNSVALMLIIFGIFLGLADKFGKKLKEIKQLNLSNSLVIGLAQAIALIPGVSRSGITIIAGLSQKLKRESAARFSFLLSMPIIFGAGIKKISEISISQNNEIIVLVLGFLSAAISGYLCIKYFLKFLENHSLWVFVWYRVVLGVVILVILFI